ncbi:LysR substrate-binding domain-containing protein [Vibrio sp. MACH09]|uniref:LysR substrate-binding domain-containing protein n=1 Tax=Vibrio sp. MACH09 TaxID=3025122 RepID=UPI00398C1859
MCGAGLAIQPTYLVNQYIESGQLQQVLPDWKPNDLTIYVLYSSRKYMSPTVRALIDYLSEYFSESRW